VDQELSPPERAYSSTALSGCFVEKPQVAYLLQQVKLLQQLAAEPVEGDSVDAYRERCAAISEHLSSLAAFLVTADRSLIDAMASNMASAASAAADIAHQPGLAVDTGHHTSHQSSSSHGRGRKPQLVVPETRITPHVVVQAVRCGQVPTDLDKPCSHAFGQATDDHMRLVMASALGIPETSVYGLWSPPLRQKQPSYFFRKFTGGAVKPFRGEVRRELVADLQSLLLARILEIARDEATRLSPERRGTAPLDVSKVFEKVVLRSHSHHDLKALSDAFGIDFNLCEKFSSFVLWRAKPAMFELIENGPLACMLGNYKVQLVREYVLGRHTLRALGDQTGLSRERIRQIVEEVAVCSPLVRAVIESKEPSDWPAQRKMADREKSMDPEMLASLIEVVRQDPLAAYQRALSLDRQPLQRAHETTESYHERIFLAAFAGSYIDGWSARQYPSPLRNLIKRGKSPFRELAFSCADQKIRESIDGFKLEITTEQIASLLSEKTSLAPFESAPDVLKFVERLIRQPSNPRPLIWRSIDTTLPPSRCDEVFSVVEPLVRCVGVRRAEQACSVFEEPWVKVWLRDERLVQLLDARVRRQQPISSAARELGFTIGTFAGVWAQLQSFFPSVSELVPRMAVSPRSGL